MPLSMLTRKLGLDYARGLWLGSGVLYSILAGTQWCNYRWARGALALGTNIRDVLESSPNPMESMPWLQQQSRGIAFVAAAGAQTPCCCCCFKNRSWGRQRMSWWQQQLGLFWSSWHGQDSCTYPALLLEPLFTPLLRFAVYIAV